MYAPLFCGLLLQLQHGYSHFLIEAKLRGKKDENLHFFFLMQARITVRKHVLSLAEQASLPTA